MSVPYCVKCGKPRSSSELFVGEMCLRCFLEYRKPLEVPRRIEFEYCKSCGAYKFEHQWFPGGEPGEAAIAFTEKWVKTKLKPRDEHIQSYKLITISPKTKPSWRTILNVRLELIIKGLDTPIEVDYDIEVYARPTLCPSCKFARGGDYNVILQIRGRVDREVVQFLEEVFESTSQIASSIIDVIESKGGLDILLLDRGAASKIISMLKKYYKLQIRQTSEVVGIDSRGLLRKRIVFSIRIMGSR